MLLLFRLVDSSIYIEVKVVALSCGRPVRLRPASLKHFGDFEPLQELLVLFPCLVLRQMAERIVLVLAGRDRIRLHLTLLLLGGLQVVLVDIEGIGRVIR